MQEAAAAAAATLRQHLIDPEVCIRCNTCEATCPRGAVTHDTRNYVVDPALCGQCLACLPPCPTGAIDHWRVRSVATAYSVQEQLAWDALPQEHAHKTPHPSPLPQAGEGAHALGSLSPVPGGEGWGRDGGFEPLAASPPSGPGMHAGTRTASEGATPSAVQCAATLPPWSAAHAYTQLYGPGAPHAAQRTPLTARVAGNLRVTALGSEYDTHHIVLDFGRTPFPLLEGQSIGIVPPGVDADGRAHHARQYSVSSPRDGERAGYNNAALTVKRVLQDHQGQPVRGVASNHLCELCVGDTVRVVGPFGTHFLMPNHPRSHLVMICTGTGSAPMRAMTERRRRLREQGGFEGGRLLLFFGARTPQELPYFGPLQRLPHGFIDIHFAFSRVPGQPRVYVQDLLREHATELAPLLADADAFFYVCGLRAMEAGVLGALRDVAQEAGMDWPALAARLKGEGRLHLETY